MLRIFNVKEGFSRNNDTLPGRLFEPLESGALKGAHIPRGEFEKALSLYYEMMGWGAQSGEPTWKKIRGLDIQDLL